MKKKLFNFSWKGTDENGFFCEGELEATSPFQVRRLLKQKNITLKKINQCNRLFGLIPKTVPRKSLTQFTRNLAYLVQAGIPLSKSLTLLAASEHSHSLKKVITSLHQEIARGQSFSMAIAKQTCFDPIYRGFIYCGEQTGRLDAILNNLVYYREKQEEVHQKLLRASLYPLFIFLITLLVSIFLLLFVIPAFQELFESTALPLPYLTQIMLLFSYFLRQYFLSFALLLILLATIAYHCYSYSLGFRRWISQSILRFPFWGKIILKAHLIRIVYIMAMSLSSGLAITLAIKYSRLVIKNIRLKNTLSEIYDALNQGQCLSQACLITKIFPDFCIQLMQIGEESGQLDKTLFQIARHYTEELDSFANHLSQVLEPFLLIIMSGLVGTVIIAMYLPIFQLGNLMR